jgi:hypothetical protein
VAEYILKIDIPSETINFPTQHISTTNRPKIDSSYLTTCARIRTYDRYFLSLNKLKEIDHLVSLEPW